MDVLDSAYNPKRWANYINSPVSYKVKYSVQPPHHQNTKIQAKSHTAKVSI